MAVIKVRSIFLLFTFFLINNGTKGYPRRWYSDFNTPAGNQTNFDVYHLVRPTSHLNAPSKVLSKIGYVQNSEDRTDGKIIFPNDDSEVNLSRKHIPSIVPDCENSTFCENPVNYPNDFLEAALRKNKDLKFLAGVDLVPDVVHRFNIQPEDSPLCESYEKVVYPKAAQNKDKEWLFVVNQPEFTQGVRVETCGKKDSVCNLVDGFAEGYKTTCKQKYIYRQLVSVSSMGQLQPDMFRIPASCCCHIKFTGNPLLRLGISSSKKSDLPMSKVRKK